MKLSDVVGAAPTTSTFSTWHLASMDCAMTTARRDEKHLSLGFGASYIRGFTVHAYDTLAIGFPTISVQLRDIMEIFLISNNFIT